ncbi:C-C motif chemokine 36.1 [Takifugu rubripes]|uniref:C-C motif chemokine 14-like n=1 Tax=Takifugu rubripes TaxID=31033 RepID=A0A674MK38_TAKRU|nr:C-C motif chemokine 14-like [Takifugu rubripes]|eukprot:XP_003966784.1 PREDICTED: C-C motif chemokine 14-like [Takifugu rubripes]
MKTAHFLLVCIIGAALLASAFSKNEIGPDDCCFKFYPRRVKRALVRSYYITDKRCPKPGVVLVTQKSRHICVDQNISWVDNLMKNLDEETF